MSVCKKPINKAKNMKYLRTAKIGDMCKVKRNYRNERFIAVIQSIDKALGTFKIEYSLVHEDMTEEQGWIVIGCKQRKEGGYGIMCTIDDTFGMDGCSTTWIILKSEISYEHIDPWYFA